MVHFMQHYPMPWPGNFCANKLHIDYILPLKVRGSSNYDTPCRSTCINKVLQLRTGGLCWRKLYCPPALDDGK